MKTCPLLTAVAAATTERDGEMSWTLSLSLRVLIAQIKTHLLSDSITMSKIRRVLRSLLSLMSVVRNDGSNVVSKEFVKTNHSSHKQKASDLLVR